MAENDLSLKDFLQEFREVLLAKVQTDPVYRPDRRDAWDRQALGRLDGLLRKPFESQIDGILALAKGFYQEGQRAGLLVGEMGVGKTLSAIAVAHLSPRRRHRTLVMCPGHLVEKWKREIIQTVPDSQVIDLNGPGLKELLALKGQKPQGREFWVIGKERAKNHYAFRSAFVHRPPRHGLVCPTCGVKLDPTLALSKRKLKCEKCRGPLWQGDTKFRRFAKAEFIKRYLPKGTFDLLIADEVHEYKGADTAQGQALACLAASAKRSLALTGTLMGGYSTNLFYLLWRLFPNLIRDKAQYGAEKAFAARYGILETIEKTPLRDNHHSLGGRKNREITKEKPGVSPLVLTDFLLGHSVFLRLQDIGKHLPPYLEEVVDVEMLPEQEEEYRQLEDDLRKACRQALAMGDHSLLGALVQSLLAYPDGCRRGEVVLHPHTGELVAEAAEIQADLLPKEQKLLDLVRAEVAQGRKCLVCLEHTGKRDLIPTLTEKLGRIGITPLVLRADNPPVAKREAFIRQMAPRFEVMIANTNLIKTGLDLVEFPTLIFFQAGYSVFTLRQASRRSWRIGQEQPVKVYYLHYGNTMQELALTLLASKMETALAVEGDLTDKGLLALAESGNSMLLELARTLVGDLERPAGLEGAWQSFQGAAMQADALLGLEHPVQTVTQTTTTITQGDRRTTVTVTRVVRGRVYPKGEVGVGYVGPHRLLFKNGRVFYQDRPVGEYDRTGKGQINGKPIKLQKDGHRFLLVELRHAA
jgi:SNF2 family DNA or RNA helicase